MLWRILLNLRADRDRPPLEQLDAETDPERFVWTILPHAARTFSFCIVFLPPRSVRALAVGYLYCRILDTYEDLATGVQEKTESLAKFTARFDRPADSMGATHTLDPAQAEDVRDRAHVLLVRRVEHVDAMFAGLPADQQAAIRRLVRRMARGMIWSSTIFDQQAGVLKGGDQLSEYCWHVLGTTMLFAEEMQALDQGREAPVPESRIRACAAAGEAIQLANITRDVDKDDARGIAYHPDLQPGRTTPQQRGRARRDLLLRALGKGDALRELVEGMPFPRWSRARGAAFLLVLTTYAYYQRACRRAGLRAFDDEAPLGLARGAWWYLNTVLSHRRTVAILRRLAAGFQRARQRELAEGPVGEALDAGAFDVVECLQSERPDGSLATD